MITTYKQVVFLTVKTVIFLCICQMPVLDNNFLKSKIWAYVTNNFNLLESWDLGRVLFAKKNPMGIIIGKRFKQE